MPEIADQEKPPVTEANVQTAIEDGIDAVTEVLGEDCPQPTWDLGKLKTYVNTIGRKMAIDVWRLGRALMFARRQINDRTAWKPWVAANCPDVSYRTAMRYVELARTYSTFEEIEKDGVRSAYLKAGIIKGAECGRLKGAKQGVVKAAARTTKPTVKTKPPAKGKDEDARIVFARFMHDDDEQPVTINPIPLQIVQDVPGVAYVIETPPTANELVLKAVAVAVGIENSPDLPMTLKPQLTALRDILRELEQLVA